MEVLPIDGEQEASVPYAGSFAIRARMLHHHLVEPCFHARAGLAALAIAPVLALNAAGNAAEASLFSIGILASDLGIGRGKDGDLLAIEAIEDCVASFDGQFLPRSFQ